MAKENRLGGLGWIKQTLVKEPSQNDQPKENVSIKLINLNDIQLNPHQPRKTFTEKEMEELKASIKKDGLLQSVVVATIENSTKYLLVAGERRVRAARALGLIEIPAMITEGDPAEIGLIENIQRQNLNPIEEAFAYSSLIVRKNYTQKQLAEVLGKKQALVSKMVQLTSLPEEVLKKCSELNINRKEVLFNISKFKNEKDMLDFIEKVESENLSIKNVRELTQQKPSNKLKQKITPTIKYVNALLNILEKTEGFSDEEKEKIKELYGVIKDV